MNGEYRKSETNPLAAIVASRCTRARHGLLALSAILSLGGWAETARAQEPPGQSALSRTFPGTLKPAADPSYVQPTEMAKLRNYLFDAFGPYPMVGAAFTAGISQMSNGVPEWGQGAEGFGKRMGSAFGIAAVTTTARFAMSAAFHEDTLYYGCDCKGALPRLKHAVLSTVTARRGRDGRQVFSLPGLAAPYIGAATAVYGWYPDRYNGKDAFRMGNYSLLASVGGNIALEFLFRGAELLAFPAAFEQRANYAGGGLGAVIRRGQWRILNQPSLRMPIEWTCAQ